MVPVLTALIAAVALVVGYLLGFWGELYRTAESRRARKEDREWLRSERKREALTELQRALGEFVVRHGVLADAAISRHNAGQPWERIGGGFSPEVYESQLRALFLATQTADSEVHLSAREVVAASEAVLRATGPEVVVEAFRALTAALGKTDELIFERLTAGDIDQSHGRPRSKPVT